MNIVIPMILNRFKIKPQRITRLYNLKIANNYQLTYVPKLMKGIGILVPSPQGCKSIIVLRIKKHLMLIKIL